MTYPLVTATSGIGLAPPFMMTVGPRIQGAP